MIVTLTANPSLDRTVVLAEPLRPGEVQQAVASHEDPGGKGVNVARVLRGSGSDALAVLPLAEGDPYAGVLADAVAARAVPVAGLARSNIAVTDPAGTTTKVNLPGAELSAEEADALVDAVVVAARDARAEAVALCGSLPPGVDDGFYARVAAAVRAGVDPAPLVVVDTSGPALAATVASAHPDLIKPNELELAELAGVGVPAGPDLVDAVARIAREVVPAKVGAALVTLGGEGAVLVTADGAWHAPIPAGVQVQSTVGAGDSSLAGYLLAFLAGASEDDLLRSAVRYGSATASLPGTQLASPADLPAGDIPVRAIP
ncbi:hexose kinase [Microbacterium betulae]|uniref:Hexose kinase n=1 Tax=Microbacterium betulae TaxID=2981139 RepID=A0AA97FIE0_9MICO|nr:hexose kinase [Microbacterium sp. AB]WOF23605.1 hexose kinase [Microbacterium sp. AB]